MKQLKSTKISLKIEKENQRLMEMWRKKRLSNRLEIMFSGGIGILVSSKDRYLLLQQAWARVHLGMEQIRFHFYFFTYANENGIDDSEIYRVKFGENWIKVAMQKMLEPRCWRCAWFIFVDDSVVLFQDAVAQTLSAIGDNLNDSETPLFVGYPERFENRFSYPNKSAGFACKCSDRI